MRKHISIKWDYRPRLNTKLFNLPASYVFRVDVGTRPPFIGAGYIGGLTLYFGLNTGSANWHRTVRAYYQNKTFFGFEFGITRNANRVPYVTH